MQRTLLKAKIHRATVTDANLEYEGSVTIDSRLLELADIVEFEQVHVYNITNGNRLTTYAISGPAGSGTICINGAGAHLVRPGHLVIICSYAQFAESERSSHLPRIIHVDERNHPRE
ncbi:aspartate 1-decarboxylase [Planctellipticum variicoloris]|uniref:aspartate 1-decarboxylase n=1 Tax=Planctellipticum variicoloris TaxID=3064265 RepID=UPI002C4FBB4B|nr:aspartate 1-decarboxylase [Planctomycetaceae bacterium SH412]HTN03251.1 aspartate 1-decarboxylase [Planctomycetaceae bacterium]